MSVEEKGVRLTLRNAEVTFRNDVHRHVDRGLAAPFNVQREGVDVGEVVKPWGRIAPLRQSAARTVR